MAERFETIVWDRDGATGVLTLDRPARRNGIVGTMMVELHALLTRLAGDPTLAVLVLRGAGSDFCPGADLKAYAAGEGGVTPLATYQVATLLHTMPAVTIAAIRGACAGAGMGWAAACDLRLAATSARFNSAFLDVGLSGDMGGPWTLSRIVGAAKARELYFLPGKFDAAEALAIGLVCRVVDDAEFDAAVAEAVRTLAAKAPLALRYAKANFIDAEHLQMAPFVELEARRHAESGRSDDAREARAAFLEKRAPRFGGR